MILRFSMFVLTLLAPIHAAYCAEYNWEATAKVVLSRNRSLPWWERSTIPISAPDEKSAVKEAEQLASERIKSAYPSAEIVSLQVKVESRSTPLVNPADDTTVVRMYVRTPDSLIHDRSNVEVFGQSVSSDREVYTSFNLRVYVSVDGENERKLSGVVRTLDDANAKTGPVGATFDLWRGEIRRGDSKVLTVRVVQEEPWSNEFANTPNPWNEVSQFTVELRNGREFSTSVSVDSNCERLRGPSTGPESSTLMRLTRKPTYYASLNATHLHFANQASFVASTKRANEEAEFAKQLIADPEVQILQGSATFKPTQETTVGFGLTFLVSADRARAERLARGVFANRPDIRFAADVKEAERILKEEFEARRNSGLREYAFDETTLKLSLSPKTGKTMTEVIQGFTPDPRSRRPKR
ncbi:hypothetical protein V5E97_24815 [Singulisphaera sp. Ch08]|uniref:Uncharacterized protein n=1 Tax=Singulisphaera sp. Ch08 TaxID=3120278 RepID=A0AAU7C9Z5_9BACT